MDRDLHLRTVIGTGTSSNLATVVVIGIEPEWTEVITNGIAKTGKPVTGFSIEQNGDLETIRAARWRVKEYVHLTSELQNEPCSVRLTPRPYGDIRLGGRPINNIPPHKRGIGMVFQNFGTAPNLTNVLISCYEFPLRIKILYRTCQRCRSHRAPMGNARSASSITIFLTHHRKLDEPRATMHRDERRSFCHASTPKTFSRFDYARQ